MNASNIKKICLDYLTYKIVKRYLNTYKKRDRYLEHPRYLSRLLARNCFRTECFTQPHFRIAHVPQHASCNSIPLFMDTQIHWIPLSTPFYTKDLTLCQSIRPLLQEATQIDGYFTTGFFIKEPVTL